MAARTLFSEALRDLPRRDISVVSLAADLSDQDNLKTRYKNVLGHIPDDRFSFDGALDWIRGLR